MKKVNLTIMLISLSTLGFSQFEYIPLEFNDAKTTLANGGVLFNSPSISPGYEIPSGSGNHSIFGMGFWFGGKDTDNQLKLAASTYTQGGDFFPGALTVDGLAELPMDETASKGIYSILKSEIEYHTEHFDDLDYVVPSSILEWPAHGDADFGLDYYLAPFVDFNEDGIYNPENGDYPKIKGDQAVYFIVNDKGGVHESGGQQIGLEIHYLIYQYATDDYLNNTTFINMRVINRSMETLYGFKGGCYLDSDIGYSGDDFAGCYSEQNVMFAYNSDGYDEGVGGETGYGENPPAIGVVLLNHTMEAFVTGENFILETAMDYYGYMSAYWPDGEHFTLGGTGYGGGVNTNFIFDGNPNMPGHWSEVSAGIFGSDRWMMMSTDVGEFQPNDMACFDFAVLYNRDGDPKQNAEGIINLASEVQSFYNSDDDSYCAGLALGIAEEMKTNQLTIFPNPSNGILNIQTTGTYSATVYTLDGREVYKSEQLYGNTTINAPIQIGTYLIVLNYADSSSAKQLLIIR